MVNNTMQLITHKEGPRKDAETTIKTENEEKSQSSVAQFLKSGQVAFGSVDTRVLGENDSTPGEVQDWMLDQVRERLASASDLHHEDVFTLPSLLPLECGQNKTGFQCIYPELSRLMKSNLTYAVAFTNQVLEASIEEVPRIMKDDLLRNIAQDMSTVCIDMRDSEAVDRQLETLGQKRDETLTESRPLAKHSPAALGLFTKNLYGLGLFHQVESMLSRLRSEMDHALILDLQTIFVPFLQELIGLMLVFGVPMTNRAYGLFFESVLQNYFERFVGQESKGSHGIENRSWNLRAQTALSTMEKFDHYYFQEIMGDQYAVVVMPVLAKLRSAS
ncbi:hypothetical protein OPT61_g90 [Boeremia exigua]|uniref:Uncharacterized protein n=1 Tax=Boeremia exigua TaxID=749465 RepID=A0ACC2IV70_9PLEO|nr:hypothetical protein OPT61_g90 [Boeremia exigua]